MQTFKTWLTEGEEKVRTMTLYHGVKNPDNVKKILDNGFNLIYVEPLWINDYAVSAAKSKKNVLKFFGRDVVVLKFKFRGNVWKGGQFETLSRSVGILAQTAMGQKADPKRFTRDVIRHGIDASDQGQTVYVYNVNKISNIEIT